jgi:hypothetical protein
VFTSGKNTRADSSRVAESPGRARLRWEISALEATERAFQAAGHKRDRRRNWLEFFSTVQGQYPTRQQFHPGVFLHDNSCTGAFLSSFGRLSFRNTARPFTQSERIILMRVRRSSRWLSVMTSAGTSLSLITPPNFGPSTPNGFSIPRKVKAAFCKFQAHRYSTKSQRAWPFRHELKENRFWPFCVFVGSLKAEVSFLRRGW